MGAGARLRRRHQQRRRGRWRRADDAVSRASASSCRPTTAKAGRRAYVTSMCPPLPPAADTSQSDPRCPTALAAWDRGRHLRGWRRFDESAGRGRPGDAGRDASDDDDRCRDPGRRGGRADATSRSRSFVPLDSARCVPCARRGGRYVEHRCGRGRRGSCRRCSKAAFVGVAASAVSGISAVRSERGHASLGSQRRGDRAGRHRCAGGGAARLALGRRDGSRGALRSHRSRHHDREGAAERRAAVDRARQERPFVRVDDDAGFARRRPLRAGRAGRGAPSDHRRRGSRPPPRSLFVPMEIRSSPWRSAESSRSRS